MSQYDFGTIDPATKSGTQLANDLNSWRTAQNTNHSAATAPSYVTAGMIWLDTSGANWRLKMYDGTDHINLLTVDPTANDSWSPGSARGVLVSRTTTQSIANATNDVVLWDTEVYDTGSYHSTVSNTSRLVVPSSGVGVVRLTASVDFVANATGVRTVSIIKNGTNFVGAPQVRLNNVGASVPTIVNIVSPVIQVSASDYFEVRVYQDSGGALNIAGVTDKCWFCMEVLAN